MRTSVFKSGGRRRRAKREHCRRSMRLFGISRGFTLVEVMIASGILFVCLFAILGLMANLLRNARALQRLPVNDASSVAAYFSVLTNLHEEGIESGPFDKLGEFSERYRDLKWIRDSKPFVPYETNGLWYVVYTVERRSTRQVESTVSAVEFDLKSIQAQAQRPGGRR